MLTVEERDEPPSGCSEREHAGRSDERARKSGGTEGRGEQPSGAESGDRNCQHLAIERTGAVPGVAIERFTDLAEGEVNGEEA